ncbi:hypothetical protein MN608_10040 [Microdochium nivale]|nr:hypothetical protein MN608_10040 [Microdochium nivale]
MLNGLATLSNNPAVLLAADSFRGDVFSINTNTGHTTVVIQNDLFTPTTSLSLDINGPEVLGNYLYFTNSAQGIMALMRIHPNRTKAAEAEILATLPGTPSRSNFFDDFAARETGTGG